MATVSEISKNLDDMHDLVAQILKMIADSDAEKATLKTTLDAAVAKAAIDQAAKDALQAEIDAAWEKSESTENDLRSVVPGVPPVGGGDPVTPPVEPPVEPPVGDGSSGDTGGSGGDGGTSDPTAPRRR